MNPETTITARGLTFTVEYIHDPDAGYPWDSTDIHGPVRFAFRRFCGHNVTKRPGERVLHHASNGTVWLYDWQAACKRARSEGWGSGPHDAPIGIEKAVQADFDYLQGFLRDDWWYVGVTVMLQGSTNPMESDSLWGVETLDDYHATQAQEMADALAHQILAEREEAAFWAARDVVTETP